MLDYYPPNKISYTIEQIEWLLSYRDTLKEGYYPKVGKDESGNPGKRAPSYRAPFESPCLIIAELEARLDGCGQDGQYGQMVYNRYCDGQSDYEIARLARCSTGWVDKCICWAIWYSCGWERRLCSYSEWQKCGRTGRKRCREFRETFRCKRKEAVNGRGEG